VDGLSLMARNHLPTFNLESVVARLEEAVNVKFKYGQRCPIGPGSSAKRISTPIYGWRRVPAATTTATDVVMDEVFDSEADEPGAAKRKLGAGGSGDGVVRKKVK